MLFPRMSPLYEQAGEGSQAGAGTGEQTSGAAAFDPVAFKTEILGEFNKTLNGFSKSVQKDITKLIQPLLATKTETHEQATSTTTETATTEQAAKIDPALNAEIQKLRRESEQTRRLVQERDAELAKERSQRLETERISEIRSAMQDIPFKDERSRQLFYKAVVNDIRRDEDGNLVAGPENDPLPLKDYIKREADLSPNLLAADTGGGAGAKSGKRSAGAFNPADMANLDDLSKLTPQQRQAVMQHIASVAQQH